MFKFVRVKNTNIGTDSNWMLSVSSLKDLIEYERFITTYRLSHEFRNLLKSVDSTHNEQISSNEIVGSVHFLSKINQSSLLDTFVSLLVDAITSRFAALMEYGHIYINRRGGFVPKVDFLEEVGKPVYARWFPQDYSEDDIEILKWDGGRHYYAKIKDLDVVWRRRQKWNSPEEAKEAAEKFLKELKGETDEEDDGQNRD